MSDPAPQFTPLMKPPFRSVGYGLLILGFLWLCWSAFSFSLDVTAATSRFLSEDVPRKDTFAFTEVLEILLRLSNKIRSELPSVIIPALLMLIGGLMLAYQPATRAPAVPHSA